MSILSTMPSITTLPDQYPEEMAKLNGDLVYYSSNSMINEDAMDTFLKNVDLNQNDWLRITRYTDEGDAIIQEVSFKNGTFYYLKDTTRDAYGEKQLTVGKCSLLNQNQRVTQSGEMIDYELSGCSGGIDEQFTLISRKK